jgi:4,5-DOPA dioxygenase extradiol
MTDLLTFKNMNMDSKHLRTSKLAPHSAMAVPRAEHFVPLLIALGSGTARRDIRVLYDSIEHGTGSTLSFQF